jgi:hypothetical protein
MYVSVAGICFAATGWTSVSAAQSMSIEEREPDPPAAPPPPPPPAPPPKPVLVLPEPLATPLEYPAGAEGEASVTLELTLSAEGLVTEARALEGSEPFVSKAIEGTKAWTFRPATRDGRPVASKIRFAVKFVPPRDVAEEPPPLPDTPAPAKPDGREKPVAGATPRAEDEPYEVTVQGERAPIRHELSRVEIARMPGAFGDPYRAIEALPGVVPIVSGLPYFYVRGAPPGNVGYFFDGIPVPFLYHFAAGPGVLHPAFVDRVDLYPGAYPVRYGRFAGAIVAGEMAPPGMKTRAEWNIRIIDSGAMVEAPFAEGRGTAMVGGRYSYTAFLASLFAPDVDVRYWDYQARARYQLDSKNSVELLSFGSNDFVSYTEHNQIELSPGVSKQVDRDVTVVDIDFHRLDLRWDREIQDGKWRNALMFGRDRTGLADGEVNVYNYMVGARSEYQQQLSKRVRLRGGADALFETLVQELENDPGFDPGEGNDDPSAPDVSPGQMLPPDVMRPEENGGDDDPDFGFNRRRKDFTLGLYADLVWDVAPRVQIVPGLRLDLYLSGGDAALGVDPRITAEYTITKKLKLVHGLALVHQAPSFVAAVPGFKPSLGGGLQTALQHSAGVNYELPAGFSSSVALFQSAFYDMTDLISLVQLEQTARDEQDPNGDDDDPIDFRTGGHAYGLEIALKRSLSRKLGGFLSYTLSRSERFVRRLSGPATTDRTHVLNVGASYDLGKDWRFGGRFMIYSGIPARVAYLEAARNPPRTPPFWRFDFKLEKRWYIRRPDRWWGLNIEMLNTTLNKEKLNGSCNAYDCTYEEVGPIAVPAIAFEGAF